MPLQRAFTVDVVRLSLYLCCINARFFLGLTYMARNALENNDLHQIHTSFTSRPNKRLELCRLPLNILQFACLLGNLRSRKVEFTRGAMDLQSGFQLLEFEVLPQQGLVTSSGLKQRLEPKLMDLLVFMAQEHGSVLSKERLMHEVWGGVIAESGLSRNISQLRKILGDDAKDSAFIATVPKRGYQFLVEPKALPFPNQPLPPEETKTTYIDDRSRPFSLRLKLLIALFLSLVLIVAYLVLDNRKAVTVPLAVDLDPIALMVVPLNNREPLQESYFEDGLTEELIAILSKNNRLNIVSRTTSFAFKDKAIDAREIGKQLGVRYLVEGSLLRLDNSVRLNAQLVDAESGFTIWSQSFESNADQLYQIQEELALQVAAVLDRAFPSDSVFNEITYQGGLPKAHEYYLQGQYWCHKSSDPDFAKAVRLFEKAIQIDPGYARAWSSLARTWLILDRFEGGPDVSYLSQAESAANQALGLDPNQDEAYATLAMLKYFRDYEFEAAEILFQKAIAANDRNPLTRLWCATFFLALGQKSVAESHCHLALKLDPLSGLILLHTGDIFLETGNLDAALHNAKQVLDLRPKHFLGLFMEAKVKAANGHWQEALDQYREINPDLNLRPEWLARAYAHSGQSQEAIKLADQLIAARNDGRSVAASDLALIFLDLGDADQAHHFLLLAYQEREMLLPKLLKDPRWPQLLGPERWSQFSQLGRFALSLSPSE